MELLLLFGAGYIYFLATRTQEQQENHLLSLWGLMILGTIVSIGYQIFK